MCHAMCTRHANFITQRSSLGWHLSLSLSPFVPPTAYEYGFCAGLVRMQGGGAWEGGTSGCVHCHHIAHHHTGPRAVDEFTQDAEHQAAPELPLPPPGVYKVYRQAATFAWHVQPIYNPSTPLYKNPSTPLSPLPQPPPFNNHRSTTGYCNSTRS